MPTIQVATIQQHANLAQTELEYTDYDLWELAFKIWTWTIDIIEDYLRNCLVSTEIPLACLICSNQEPPFAD